MRDVAEIERAHGILQRMTLNPSARRQLDIALEAMLGAENALCWVLNHERGWMFAELIADIEKDAGGQPS